MKFALDFLDCPVTGSKKQAEEAQLIILAGGDQLVIDQWMDLFGAIGKTVVFAGDIECQQLGAQ